jgi:5'-3' exonuclease
MEQEEIDKEKYFTLFEQFASDNKKSSFVEIDDNILIVDFLNTFMRNFTGSPAMNDNGEHVGGMTASLQSIGNAIRLTGATRCIIVSDGEGGSSRRRKVYPDYKMKRRVQSLHVNRTYEFQNEVEEYASMKRQSVRLLQYITHMPVIFVCIDNTEADDIIAYIAKEVYNKENNRITIMSSDKDFLQLVDNRIQVWSPTKKKLYTESLVRDEYGISSENFLFYRMLDGDTSDNIPGVQGTGLKTIQKYLPFVTSSKKTNIDEILDYCKVQNENKKTSKKFYTHILESKEQLEMNEKLMQLESPDISAQAKMKVTQKVTGEIPTLNKYEIHLMYMHDKLSTAMPNIDAWLIKSFGILNAYSLSKQRKIFPTGE